MNRDDAFCQICRRQYAQDELRSLRLVAPAIIDEIEAEGHTPQVDGYICLSDLNRYRMKHVYAVLAGDRGEISALEQSVLESLARHETVSQNVEDSYEKDRTAGARIADAVAVFGGSWMFLGSFAAFVAVWIGANLAILRPPDPYPFILLNLLLSCIAAVQAPIIMMSQRRQELRDRLRSRSDYAVNLKAELEVRQLHEKIDHILQQHWLRLVELQTMQMEMLDEVRRATRKPPGDYDA